MDAQHMALVQGWDRTRLALAGWNRDPGPGLGRWAAGGLAGAYVLGASASTVAAHLHISPARLLVALAPHALLELTALFLPLAAWIMASRRGRWDELLAATLVTVGLAVPALVVAALLEVYVSPHLVAFVRG